MFLTNLVGEHDSAVKALFHADEISELSETQLLSRPIIFVPIIEGVPRCRDNYYRHGYSFVLNIGLCFKVVRIWYFGAASSCYIRIKMWHIQQLRLLFHTLMKPFTKSAYIGAKVDQSHILIKTSDSFREPTILEIKDGLSVSELELLEVTFESSFCSTTKTRSYLTDRESGVWVTGWFIIFVMHHLPQFPLL